MDQFIKELQFRIKTLKPITKYWLAAITLVFFIGIVTPSLRVMLSYDGASVVQGKLWKLFTYPLVSFSALQFLINLLLLGLFGSQYESEWGSKDFLKYAILSQAGAAIIATLLSLILPSQSQAMPYAGINVLIDALLVNLMLSKPDSSVLLGFILPIKTSYIIIGFFVFELLSALNGEANHLYLYFGGLIMGYILTTGSLKKLKAKFIKPAKHKRPNLNIVKDYHSSNNNNTTLH